MKKLLALILLALFVLSFSACASNTTNTEANNPTSQIEETVAPTTNVENAQPTTQAVEDVVEETTVVDDNSSTNKQAATVTELLNNSQFKKELDSLKKSYSSLMVVDIKAKGDNVLLMEFKIKKDLNDNAIKYLKKNIVRNFKSVKRAVLQTLSNETTIKNPKLQLVIKTKDNKTIINKTYTE
ncbi:MAG: DNA repair ATPase [Ruminococcus sp.]|nr:DNA repair ATPase [Ruminococcus sp.]